MSEHNSFRAVIPPIPDGTPRPLWSVMIPTYNCANYLRETLASVLAQDPGPDIMQIEVVDDHSTKDDPEAVVRELGGDRVGFYRQPENVGHTKNFDTCLKRARGKLIHQLHGDDCVRDGFYRKLQLAFEENPNIGAAFCRNLTMDEHGHWMGISTLEQSESGVLSNWLERIAEYQRIQTPSIVVQRNVYERLGGFDYRLSWSEDWEMWVRIAAHYSVWYEVEPLAVYRIHSNSNTGRYHRSGENTKDIIRAIGIIKHYLPSDRVNQVTQKSLHGYAFLALGFASQLVNKGDTYAAINQIREAFIGSFSLKMLFYASWICIKFIYLTIVNKIRNIQEKIHLVNQTN
ncbi:glycosyltransferase [Nostoc sp. UHCC 0302]|uniref:glycosyltransferase family 2 protein n=1 Tax=Nostoc sp. UHCC 0302 TaxID=3134896 RepID=UPI00311CBF55